PGSRARTQAGRERRERADAAAPCGISQRREPADGTVAPCARRLSHDGDPRTSGPGFGVTMHEDAPEEPLRWRTPRTAFVNTMSDIGHARTSRSFVPRRCWRSPAATP